MDVNGTRFHLQYGEETWRTLINNNKAATLEVQDCNGALILKKKLFRFPKKPKDLPPREKAPELKDRRGAARDRYGNWYWIAEDEQEIRFLSPCNRQFQHFWSSKDNVKVPEQSGRDFFPDLQPTEPKDLKLRGLAVTKHHYLVVGTLDPAGLLIFDLHAGGSPIHMLWPMEVPFHPFDMAPSPNGGVWILDIPQLFEVNNQCSYWSLDGDFQMIGIDQQSVDLRFPRADSFQPEGGGGRGVPGRKFPTGITLGLATPLPEIHPVALETLPDDTVLIMADEMNHSVLYHYHFGQLLGHFPLTDLYESDTGEETKGSFDLQGHDLAFVQDPDADERQVKGKLLIADKNGNQVFAFRLNIQENSFSLELITKYYPLRRFTGKALVAARDEPQRKDQAVFYDLGNLWLPVVAHHKPRHELEGFLVTEEFDGKEPGCVWHRIIMDAVIPTGTMVEVASRAADSPDLLGATSWQSEPTPYCRNDGTELPYYTPFSQDELKKDGAGCWELLFQNARGRYLQLRLTLRGTGLSTPEINALRAYYPRFSYLIEYLPAIYQDDNQSASYLDRFLANMEGIYSTVEGKIAEAQQLFDIRLIGEEYLKWLATWFGISLDPSWDEGRQRLFLHHAIDLFQQRGTLSGLIRTIRLALDPCVDETLFTEDVAAYLFPEGTSQYTPFTVRIVERYLSRRAPGVVFGNQTQPDILHLAETTEHWSPEKGARPLHQSFQEYVRILLGETECLSEFLNELQVSSLNEMKLSPVKPDNKTEAAVWKNFISHEIGFTYAEITKNDEPYYQSFLKHRYRQIGNLNQAYRCDFNSFSTVPLPHEDDMPASGSRLIDWIQFVSMVVPIQRYAHQFTVLVPINLENDSLIQVEERVALARRIVNLEKPSHTKCDVQPYWALFRVGEARVGLDTLLGRGSRFVSLILGHGHLAETYLGSAHPWNVTDRIISDRGKLGSEMVL